MPGLVCFVLSMVSGLETCIYYCYHHQGYLLVPWTSNCIQFTLVSLLSMQWVSLLSDSATSTAHVVCFHLMPHVNLFRPSNQGE
jgi:hypothetical protein